MTTLFTLTFQGELTAAGPLSPEEAREAARSAFPMSPPRDAALKPGFRAFKMAPLESGRLLFATVENQDDRDGYDRPVLRAAVHRGTVGGVIGDPAFGILRTGGAQDQILSFQGRNIDGKASHAAAPWRNRSIGP